MRAGGNQDPSLLIAGESFGNDSAGTEARHIMSDPTPLGASLGKPAPPIANPSLGNMSKGLARNDGRGLPSDTFKKTLSSTLVGSELHQGENVRASMGNVMRAIRVKRILQTLEHVPTRAPSSEDIEGSSLFILRYNNIVRKFITALSRSTLFQGLMTLCVLASSVTVVITPPFGADSRPSPLYILNDSQLKMLELIFNVIFSVEAVLLIISKGLVLGKKSYLQSNWHRLDTLILTVSWIDYFNLIDGYQQAKTLRILRVLKPLRMIKRNQGMREVCSALVAVMIPLSYVLAFLFTFILAFSILAVGLFGGKLSSCSNPVANYPLVMPCLCPSGAPLVMPCCRS